MTLIPSSSPDPDHADLPFPSPLSSYDPIVLALPFASPPSKKPQPKPWTPQETAHLISTYQDKWYSLKRGPVRIAQWDEIAITLATRYVHDGPPRTATQCRHKLEKLRKRYRIEKRRVAPSPPWEFFDLMDCLERGVFPISAKFPDWEAKNWDDSYGMENCGNIKSRSLNYILRRHSSVGGENDLQDFRANGDLKEEEEDSEEGGLIWRLAVEVRKFGQKIADVENRKMEMMKETHMCKVEMENRRAEMILHSQKKIVETISRALGGASSQSHKKLKVAQQL